MVMALLLLSNEERFSYFVYAIMCEVQCECMSLSVGQNNARGI